MTFYRASLLWAMPNGEEAVNSLGIEDDGVSTTDQIASAVASAATTFMDNVKDRINGQTSLQTIRVYRLPSITGKATEAAEAPVGIVGTGGGAGALPNQVSCVASLLTSGVGRSRRGRIFLPINAAGTTEGSGLYSSDVVTQVASVTGAFLGNINSAANLRFVKVFSRTLGQAITVTDVSVGNVPDTQRRRRNGLVEVRTTVPVSLL